MFKKQGEKEEKKQERKDTIETVIGPSVKLEGNFVSEGNILVEGEVDGKLETTCDLRAGENSKIIADIKAKNAIIAGEVRGNIEIDENLEILSTAKITGDIKTKRISIEDGAILNGNLQMTEKKEEEQSSSLI